MSILVFYYTIFFDFVPLFCLQCRNLLCSGLIKLCYYTITTKSAKPQKNIRVFFQVMAYVHLLNKDTEPFAKCELDPMKVKWEPTHLFGIYDLEKVVCTTEKWDEI